MMQKRSLTFNIGIIHPFSKRCCTVIPIKPVLPNNTQLWAMSQMLPTHNFRWLTTEEISNLIIMQLDENSEDGYIFEVNCFQCTFNHSPFIH